MHDIESALILQKDDGPRIDEVMKTMRLFSYNHNKSRVCIAPAIHDVHFNRTEMFFHQCCLIYVFYDAIFICKYVNKINIFNNHFHLIWRNLKNSLNLIKIYFHVINTCIDRISNWNHTLPLYSPIFI